MHSITGSFCFIVLSILLTLAEAGWEVRGVDALYFYTAYRMDVEISAAKALEDTDNPTWDPQNPNSRKPWRLGRDIEPSTLPGDLPTGQTDKYGLNWHSFIRGSQSSNSNYPKNNLGGLISNSWAPTLEEVKNMARFSPDDGSTLKPVDDKDASSTEKFTFAGFDLHKILGTMDADPNGNANKDKYFNFDNVLRIVGQRAFKLYKLDPQRARPYLLIMEDCLRESYIGRGKDAEKFKVDNLAKEIIDFDKKSNKEPLIGNNEDFIKKKTTTIAEQVPGGDKSVLFASEKVEAVDIRETIAALKKKLGPKHKFIPPLVDFLKEAAQNWGETGELKKKGAYGGGSAKIHQDVRKDQAVLRSAMANQLGNAMWSFAECGYSAPRDPKRLLL